MGRLTRALLVASITGAVLAGPAAEEAAAFDGFGAHTVESTFEDGITFTVELPGGAPEQLQLLLSFPGSDASDVVPIDVEPDADSASLTWNTSVDHVTPNTTITYRWRGIDGGEVTTTEPATHRFDDDRPGLDWQSAQLGEATVHWYGDAEGQAIRFGELTAQGVARAEGLLGTELAGPVDIFVYDTQEHFFGALGPGAREWTGAAAFSELRTIFMWLGGGPPDYLEVAMLHEVTHIVFHDATDNPYHEPARWLNEGIATWAETSSAAGERELVELEARGAGLFSFEAITEQFPIGERGGRLSYAQGATMIDLIVERYGEAALARITEAYRGGATDAEALEAGTGIPAEELYAAFFEEFGVPVPEPIEPEPIPASNVDRPAAGTLDEGGVDPDAGPPTQPRPPDEEPAPGPAAPAADTGGLAVVALLVVAGAIAVAAAVAVSRRAERRGTG